jgi:hypothetical protein
MNETDRDFASLISSNTEKIDSTGKDDFNQDFFPSYST